MWAYFRASSISDIEPKDSVDSVVALLFMESGVN